MLSPTRRRVLARLYGLTEEDYLVIAGDRCCLCGKPWSNSRRPVVDHDHHTFVVRGAPCGPCNQALGYRADAPGWYRAVADYLEHPPAVGILGRVHRVPDAPPVPRDDAPTEVRAKSHS